MICELESASVYYERYGSGTPILMLHGYYLDHRCMKGCMEPIFGHNQGWECIYFDLPGMGRTELRGKIDSSDDIYSLVREFIETVLEGRKFVVVGYSYGGYLARALIRQFPERILGLCLFCPVIDPDLSNRDVPPGVVLQRDASLKTRLTREEMIGFNYGTVIQTENVWNRYREEIVTGVNLADHRLLDRIQIRAYGLGFDVDDLEEPFMKPSLFLMGRQDSIVGYRGVVDIMESYPRASVIVMDKAGHVLQIEQEKLFSELMIDWLARVREEID